MLTKNELFKNAVKNWDLDAIEALLPDIASITELNVASNTGDTALMQAVEHLRINIVKALLAAGANKEAKNCLHQTAIVFAVVMNDLDILKVLLTSGANKNPTCNENDALLMEALEQNGHNPAALFILKNFGTFQYRLSEIEFDENKIEPEEQETYASLRDPITLEIMNDPVGVSSGITYDRKSLQDLFASKKNPMTQEIPATIPCPITKLPIERSELNNKTQVIIKGVIDNFVSKQEIKFKNSLQANASSSVACASNVGVSKQTQQCIKGEVTSLRNGDSKSSSSVTRSTKK